MAAGRPKKYEDLVPVQVQIPIEHRKLCTQENLNMSQICRDAIAMALNKQTEKNKDTAKNRLIKKFQDVPDSFFIDAHQAILSSDPQYQAGNIRAFINTLYTKYFIKCDQKEFDAILQHRLKKVSVPSKKGDKNDM